MNIFIIKERIYQNCCFWKKSTNVDNDMNILAMPDKLEIVEEYGHALNKVIMASCLFEIVLLYNLVSTSVLKKIF